MPDTDAPFRPQRSPFGIVALAASLGGTAVLGRVLAQLPPCFPCPVVVVQHLSPDFPTCAPEILGRRARLEVRWAEDGETPLAGSILLAPPGRHLRVGPGGACALSDEERVQHARPAADVLFASAAESHGAGAIGVVLTGRGRDGAEGAVAIRRRGGVVIAQDPATCVAADMPRAVLAGGGADFVLPPERIGSALVSLVMVPGAPALFGLAVA